MCRVVRCMQTTTPRPVCNCCTSPGLCHAGLGRAPKPLVRGHGVDELGSRRPSSHPPWSSTVIGRRCSPHSRGLTLHASRVTAMDKYEIVAQVGEGAYGVVYHVKCRVTDQRYALKCHRNYENGTMTDSTVRELSCLSALRGHPNIVETLDCFLHDGEIATLMPYLPLTLFEVIYQGRYHSGLLPITFIGRFSLEIADALAYMHGLNMIHRDLTPANVLLTADTLTVKVADMGLSRYAAKSMSSGLVTESYRAPELFDTKKEGIAQYTCAIDMWSLGVLIVDYCFIGTCGLAYMADINIVTLMHILVNQLCFTRKVNSVSLRSCSTNHRAPSDSTRSRRSTALFWSVIKSKYFS
uniref:Protein kinase domain-containing protein n=1 Tax=Maylandia zebra TaxID=106582 RepID=A0A3P9DAC3_9CICH